MEIPGDEAVERRKLARSRAATIVTIRESGRSATGARLLDVSPMGCRVGLALTRLGGDTVSLTIAGNAVQATVRWTGADSTGIRFAQRLEPATMRLLNGGAPFRAVPPAPSAAPVAARVFGIGQRAAGNEQLLASKAPRRDGFRGLIARKVARTSNHRAETRFAEVAAINCSGVTMGGVPVRIRDIAPSGICLSTVPEAEIGSTVDLGFDSLDPIPARIVWIGAEWTGLKLPEGAIDLREG